MAGTITMNIENHRVFGETTTRELIFTCTADSAAATYPATSTGTKTNSTHNRTFTEHITGWFLQKIIVDPGATAPTVNSDLTITDSHGIDILDGNGTDLIHNTTSKQSYFMIAGVTSLQPILGDLTVTITNNSVNSAIIVISLVCVRAIT